MNSERIRNIFFFILLAIAIIAFLVIILPFLYPLFWAAIIAILFRPVHSILSRRFQGHPDVAASISLCLIILILLIPLGIVSTLLVNEFIQMYNNIAQGDGLNETVRQAINAIKHNRLTDRLNINEEFLTAQISSGAREISGFLYNQVKSFTQNAFRFIVMFVIMLYILYFFLRDGDRMSELFSRVCPLGNQRERVLYHNFITTIRATLKGTVVIGFMQGVLGGILFMAVGIQGALIWGVVMVFLAILPIGSAVVWVPAALIMLLTSHIWQGIVIIVTGTLIIGTVDNFLRPILVGKELQMHPVLMLLSSLGGIFFFGFSGFIIGPVIVSILLALWSIYEVYQDSLSCDGKRF